MARVGANSLYGTVNLLILKTVASQPDHGLGIARRIQESSGDELQIEEGALYPALARLERDGFLTSEWGQSESNRRAKFYSITPTGQARLTSELERWVTRTQALCGVLGVAWTVGR